MNRRAGEGGACHDALLDLHVAHAAPRPRLPGGSLPTTNRLTSNRRKVTVGVFEGRGYMLYVRVVVLKSPPAWQMPWWLALRIILNGPAGNASFMCAPALGPAGCHPPHHSMPSKSRNVSLIVLSDVVSNICQTLLCEGRMLLLEGALETVPVAVVSLHLVWPSI